MVNLKSLIAIAKKEFFSYFNTSTGYILIVPFLLITFFLFFRSAFLSNQASLRPFFDLLPFILLLFAPAIAMRTFAQEQKNQTLELLFAHPITEAEIVLGKFLGALGFFAALLATTVTLPLTVFVFSSPDPGVIVAQYLGALFVGGAFLSIGIASAALTAAQVSSFLLAAAISFGFILVGFDIVLLSLPSILSSVITQLAILPHMNNISRGVLDMRDILYFVTVISLFLLLAIIKLSQRLTVEDPHRKMRLNIALGLIIGIGMVANIAMYSYPIRLDLTLNRLFTLSSGTKATLQQLPDIVTVTLYTSSNLPGPVETSVRKVKDTLKDYTTLGKGNVKLVERHPDENNEDKNLAQEEGIQQVQFNTLANNSFAVQGGFFGLTLQYGDKKETIPYIQDVDDLEYQLTRRIRKMTSKEQTTVALFSPSASPYSQEKTVNVLRDVLETQYTVETVDLNQKEAALTAKSLIVYGLEDPLSATASAKISDYLAKGGKAALLLDNHKINPQTGTAIPYATGLESILDEYGITLNKNIAYDIRQNETITLGNGNVQYLMPYPFFVKALPAEKSFPVLNGINTVTLAWPDTLEIQKREGVNQTKLLKTSITGGFQQGTYTIAPDKIKPDSFEDVGKELTLAAAAQKGNSKIIVVGDSEFITDQFTRSAPGDLNFASSIIDWLSADDAVASITRKTGDNPVFQFSSPIQAQIVQYANILLVPIIVAAFGGWYLNVRKRLTRRQYLSEPL